MQWCDIDFTKGILTIFKSCHDSKTGLVIDETQMTSSFRMIPLSKQLMPLMKMLKSGATMIV